MLVVVTIIALFAALVAPRMFRRATGAYHGRARADQFLHDRAGHLQAGHGRVSHHRARSAALRAKPAEANHVDGPYLPQEIPVDPWGHPYVYKYPGEHGDEPD